MSLINFFNKGSLTTGQYSLVIQLEDFLLNDLSCYLVKGSAGTGKTFMMKGLTDYLTSIKRNFKIATPTGRAAKVISDKTKKPATTIHKMIYSGEDIREYKHKDIVGAVTVKFYFGLKFNADSADTVYIIDESSMISDFFNENEFLRFGSGELLKDLIEYINPYNPSLKRKIIFVGDRYQLPPMNASNSPALDKNYLQSEYKLKVDEFELKKVVRQEEGSGILENAVQIRELLSQNIFNQIEIKTNNSDVLHVEHKDLLQIYLKACNNKICDDTIIVAHTNASVKEYNDFVREHFFQSKKEITSGDKVVVTKNNYKYQVLNGEFGIVLDAVTTFETESVPLKKKGKDGVVNTMKVNLKFRNVAIQIKDSTGNEREFECKIIENLLDSKEATLSRDEQNALYVLFKRKNSMLKVGSPEFKEALRDDPYFNALQVKYGYAVTCHKAQGGEWKNVFVNCSASMGYFNPNYFRWLYTAITRTKEKLYTLNEPHFRVGSTLKPPQVSNLTTKQNLIILNGDILENEISFSLPKDQPFLKNIYYAIFDLTKDEAVCIDSIHHHNYCEHYTFSKELDRATFKIHYNNRQKISCIEKQINLTQQWVIELFNLLKTLENKTIVLKTDDEQIADEKVFDFPIDKPFLKEFYENIKSKLSTTGINILDIDHKKYHEIYTFGKSGLVAVYKFHYNRKGMFTTTQIVQNRTTGLVEDINQILQDQ